MPVGRLPQRLLGLMVVAMLCAPSAARADRVGELSRVLTSDPSWRVRLQAAVVLGKLGDPRAAPALERALRDPNETVRGLAAQVLGKLHDRNAVAALERASRDPSPFVREKARRALAELRPAAPAPSSSRTAGGPLHVEIGGIGARARHPPPELTRRLRQLLADQLARTPGVTLGGPSSSGFLIDGSITKLSRDLDGPWVEVSCEVSLIVGRLPSKAMVMMTSGAATVQASRVGFRPQQERAMQADALAGAVQGAHENLLVFLRTQQMPTAGRSARR